MKKLIIILIGLLLLGTLLLAQEEAKPVPEKLQPRFAARESFLVMGLEAKNALEGDTMMALWETFFQIQPKIPEPLNKSVYGVMYYPEGYNMDTGEGYIYLVGMEVKSEVPVPEGLLIRKVPAGFYAVFEHKGKIGNIEKTYNYIYGDWLQASEFKPANQDMFELYDERFLDDSEDSIMEIWVPLVQPASKP